MKNSSASRYLLGYLSLVIAQAGEPSRLGDAAAYLDAAVERDPAFLPLLGLRLEVARLAGDKAAIGRLEAEMARLRALVPPGTPTG